MELQTPSTTTTHGNSASNEPPPISDDIDSSACSTPYVSAPSSPSHAHPISGFYHSAPTSPMHFSIASSKNSSSSSTHNNNSDLSFEFEFSAKSSSTSSNNKHESSVSTMMSSADELFLNGKIRPMKLSTHLEKPQALSPLLETQEEGRHSRVRTRENSLRRRTRSLSPLRNMHSEWNDDEDEDVNKNHDNKEIIGSSHANKNDESSMSTSSSRSSSAGRSSKRWVFLKDFLRSKSEGRSNNKFWSSIAFSPAKERKPNSAASSSLKFPSRKMAAGKPVNGGGKRRVPPSAHELHYTANRAQAEEMRKKTYLPYRQGLFGCLGFTSKGYGAVHGFARALNPVSSR